MAFQAYGQEVESFFLLIFLFLTYHPQLIAEVMSGHLKQPNNGEYFVIITLPISG